MTWIHRLYNTYQENLDKVGVFEKNSRDQEFTLMPLAHTTITAHIEVILDSLGNMTQARLVNKAEATTLAPCTEESATRSSGIAPHALFDKLVYLAGDYTSYVPGAKSAHHKNYMRLLGDWHAHSASRIPQLDSVFTYLSKGTLIRDLVDKEILWLDDKQNLLDSPTPELSEKLSNSPSIFNTVVGETKSAFVRFVVENDLGQEARLWRNTSVQQDYTSYYESLLTDIDLCFVTGEHVPISTRHPSKIRHSGDMTRLISSADKDGFTYRGRIATSRDALTVGYEVSQKAHNALKWLIEKQGIIMDGKVFLVWGGNTSFVPDMLSDGYCVEQQIENSEDQIDLKNFWFGEDDVSSGDTTHTLYANEIRKGMLGLKYSEQHDTPVTVMVLDSTTSTKGRLSIVFYHEFSHNSFLQNIKYWHNTCRWEHRYRMSKQNVVFTGAPSVRDIVLSAYGMQASDVLIRTTVERILPSVLHRQKLPTDIIRSVVQRASNPVSMDNWEWEKTLTIACSLINKQSGGIMPVHLDKENTDRNYLFGRMLAIADVIETRAQRSSGSSRSTNATRYMAAFAQHPMRTWNAIYSSLLPYIARLGHSATYFSILLDEIISQIPPEEFNNKSLSGMYLLGYHSQRKDLYTKKNTDENTNPEGELTHDIN